MSDAATSRRAELTRFVREEACAEAPLAATALAEAIRERGGDVAAILFYGSGVWQAISDDTVLDFYVLVDRYRDFEPRRWISALGHVLPPNVYHLEAEVGGRRLRCKYAVMRMAQFRRAAAGRTPTSQIWARFAQPCRLICARDDATADAVVDALVDAVTTFHDRALRGLDGAVTAEEVWRSGLAWTYRAELRSESVARGAEIFASTPTALTHRTMLAAPLTGRPVRLRDDGALVLDTAPRLGRLGGWTNSARMWIGKIATLLRLVKGAATFADGVDYILWKIERHSGVRIEPTAFQRRHPLIAGWPLLWALYRRGAFR